MIAANMILLASLAFAAIFTISTSDGADEGSCIDARTDCSSYGQSVCVLYYEWSKINCPFYCVFCDGNPAARECKDFVDNCASYTADMCTAADYRTWAENNCPKFCGFCHVIGLPYVTVSQTTLVPTVAPCVDVLNFCTVYSPKACDDADWALTYCRSYCKKC